MTFLDIKKCWGRGLPDRAKRHTQTAMRKTSSPCPVFQQDLMIIAVISFLIVILIGMASWDINFWPTDTKVYLFDVAVRLPSFRYVSEMHSLLDQDKVRWLHGKEMFILFASWMQRLIHDTRTLRPFLLLDLISTALSAVLVFLITSRYWGRLIGWVSFSLFAFSFWPYLYILFAKHQPLGLFLSLAAVYLTQRAGTPGQKPWPFALFCFLSGLALGGALFSSTVSALYIPLWVAAFGISVYAGSADQKRISVLAGRAAGGMVCVLAGAVIPVVYLTYPDIGSNIRRFFEYIEISSRYNHFYYNQPVLQEWLETPSRARGGALWIIRYFRLITPVVFPLYGLAFFYLIIKTLKRFQWKTVQGLITAGMILLSLSPPLLAELRQVAQYGGNYFPSLVGMILLIAYGLHDFGREYGAALSQWTRRVFIGLLVFFIMVHGAGNLFIFLTDIMPCRMATTYLSRFLEERGIDTLYVHTNHPHKTYFTQYLNPKTSEGIRFKTIRHVYEVRDGHILLPPVSGNSIYIAATSDYAPFDEDVYLNALVADNLIGGYARASFKTLVSSRYWMHEEEILSYRKLILGQFDHESPDGTKVHVLDARKLFADRHANAPGEEMLKPAREGLRNIGTIHRRYLYRGNLLPLKEGRRLYSVPLHIAKVGQPQDSLVAYVFNATAEDPAWTPAGDHYRSLPLESASLSPEAKGGRVQFVFEPPLKLDTGYYFVTVYRTGRADNEHFYRVQLPRPQE